MTKQIEIIVSVSDPENITASAAAKMVLEMTEYDGSEVHYQGIANAAMRAIQEDLTETAGEDGVESQLSDNSDKSDVSDGGEAEC